MTEEDKLPDNWMDKDKCFQLIDELEKHLLKRAQELPRAKGKARQKQSIRDADITRMRLLISHIKKTWGRSSSRRALGAALAARQSVLDRAGMPAQLQERLKQLADHSAGTGSDRTAEIATMNAAIRFLGSARKKAAAKRLQEAIRSAILRRFAQFQSNVGAVLRSLKRGAAIPNTRVDRALFVDDDGTPVLETEAEEVQARVRSHFEAWFGPRAERLDAAPEYIRDEYQPLSDPGAADWFSNLMDPITPDELEHTLRHLPRGKAPGKSGLINELWIHAGPDCRTAFRLLLNECLRLEDIPTSWKQSVVVPIPKTAEFTGNLDQLRPIALLESSRKALSAILTRRLSQAMEQHRVGSTWAFDRIARRRTSHSPSKGCVKQATWRGSPLNCSRWTCDARTTRCRSPRCNALSLAFARQRDTSAC
jgi:hypothetical protein